jgi:hypothetical protein
MLACARRELSLRTNVYPKWVEGGRMTAEKAAYEIECMQSICTSLEKLKMLGEVADDMQAREQQTELDLKRLNL